MPLAPLTVNKTSGDWMWTAASVLSLHGSPRLQFDPALDVDFDAPSEEVRQSGLSMLERYVSKLLEASFEDSSLFWHYAVRHVPSPSLTCAGDHASKRSRSNVQFDNDMGMDDIPAFLPSLDQPVPAHGYAAFPLGSARSECFCGWDRDALDRGLCVVPAAICQDMGFPVCTFEPGTENGNVVTARILEAWASKAPAAEPGREWQCPHLDLSDSWGIQSARDTQEWMLSGSARVQASELLRAGEIVCFWAGAIVFISGRRV